MSLKSHELFFLQQGNLGLISVCPYLFQVDLTDRDALEDSIRNDWQMWFRHYISYVIAGAFGVVFALIMPIIGCCVCCCRNNSRCGGNPDPMDGKNARCQRLTCNTLLLLLATIALLGVTSCFIATQLIKEQTNTDGVMQDLYNSLDSVDSYVDNTQGEITVLKTGLFDDAYRSIRTKLVDLPINVQTSIGLSSGAGPLLDSLQAYVTSFPSTLNLLENMENKTDDLQMNTQELTSKVESVQNNFTSDFASCNGTVIPECIVAQEMMDNLTVIAKFTTGSNLSQAYDAINTAYYGNDNISSTVEMGLTEYDKIILVVYEEGNQTIWKIINAFDEFSNKFDEFINQTLDNIEEIDLTDPKQEISNVTDDVDKYGLYVYIALTIFSSVACLIVVFFLVALLYGACGERAAPGAGCCNRGNGAGFLKAGVVFIFVFILVLMLSTTVMFLAGGLGYTEICRHIIGTDDAYPDDIQILDNMVTSYVNMSGASARTIMQNCKDDKAFYVAFDIETNYPELNISKTLDLSEYDLYSLLEELIGQNYTISQLELLNQDTINHLKDVENGLQTVDLDTYRDLTTQAITNVDVAQMAVTFNDYAERVTDADIADLFKEYSAILQGLQEDITDIGTEMQSLSDMVETLHQFNDSMNVDEFANEMQTAQNAITNETVTQAVNETAINVFNDLEKLTTELEYQVRNVIGQCFQMYNAISVSLSSICVSFLYPFNAYWFSMGWCLFFFTLLIPVVLTLMTLYRKSVQYIPIHGMDGRPKLHRRMTGGEGDNVRDSQVQVQRAPSYPPPGGKRQYQRQQREAQTKQQQPPPLPASAPPPSEEHMQYYPSNQGRRHYDSPNQGRRNKAYAPNDSDDEGGFIEYRPSHVHGGGRNRHMRHSAASKHYAVEMHSSAYPPEYKNPPDYRNPPGYKNPPDYHSRHRRSAYSDEDYF